MNCPFCGEYNDDGEILCSNCGIKLFKKESKDTDPSKIDPEWHDVDYEDGYSDVKKSLKPDIRLPFIDFRKILPIAAAIIFVILYICYKFFWNMDTGIDYGSPEYYNIIQSVITADYSSEDAAGDMSSEDLLRSSLAGVWTLTDDEGTVYPEYHLYKGGGGYIYVRGMYTKMPITWEYNGTIDHASITMYYSNNQKVRGTFVFEDSAFIVSGTPYTRVSEEDILEDDTPTYELDNASLKWAGTYWTRRLDKMSFPVIILGSNGRGQINYPDGNIVTFSWVYENPNPGHGGYIHMTYVSIDSPDYMMPADDKMLDFDAYGLFEKESD